MKEFEKDKKLESLIKETRLEKPGHKFALNVMNEIYALESTKPIQYRFPVLGRNFWILASMFAVLAIILVIVSGTGAGTGGTFNNILPVETGNVTEGYRNILDQIGNVPVSIAAILTASSMLLIIERILAKKNLFA